MSSKLSNLLQNTIHGSIQQTFKTLYLVCGVKKKSKTLDIGVEIIKIKEHPTNTCALTTCLKIFTSQFFVLNQMDFCTEI